MLCPAPAGTSRPKLPRLAQIGPVVGRRGNLATWRSESRYRRHPFKRVARAERLARSARRGLSARSIAGDAVKPFRYFSPPLDYDRFSAIAARMRLSSGDMTRLR